MCCLVCCFKWCTYVQFSVRSTSGTSGKSGSLKKNTRCCEHSNSKSILCILLNLTKIVAMPHSSGRLVQMLNLINLISTQNFPDLFQILHWRSSGSLSILRQITPKWNPQRLGTSKGKMRRFIFVNRTVLFVAITVHLFIHPFSELSY